MDQLQYSLFPAPYLKKTAVAYPILAQTNFKSTLAEFTNAVLAYTDGSVGPEFNSAACATFIPSLDIEKAWSLTKVASIYTAELEPSRGHWKSYIAMKFTTLKL